MSNEREYGNGVNGVVHGSVLQARTVTAQTIIMHPPLPPVAVAPPRQLPLPARAWVNRDNELAVLNKIAESGAAVRIVLSGLGGVGKTALAVRWLHQHQASHPDGALYANLGSGRAFQHPATPQQVLAGWLRALGIATDALPADLSELTALYRTVTAEKSLVVLADNAASATQIRPLLPASPTSAILVTSRYRLAGLRMDGFEHLDLDCLTAPTGAELLAGLLDAQQQPDERDVLEELSVRCHGHPLALSIVGAHLAARPRLSPARLISRFDADQHNPVTVNIDEASVGGVFDMSYDALDADAARLYRVLDAHPGVEFTLEPAAAGLGATAANTERALAKLLDANLVTEVRDERYRVHDLLRRHAQARAEQHDDQPTRRAALRRMIEWYLRRVAAADMALNPLPRRFSPVYEQLDTTVFTSPQHALDWFTIERANVLASQHLASQHGWDGLVYQLAEALWNPLRLHYAADELVETQQLGVEAARRCQHVLEAVCLTRLGFGETNRAHHDVAITACTTALERAREFGDKWVQSAALSTRARAFTAADDPRSALQDLASALEIDEQLNHRRSVGLRHRRIGQAYAHRAIADYPQAIWHLQLSAEIMQSLGDEIAHARAITYMAAAHVEAGQPDAALSALRQVIDTFTSSGAVGYLAQACTLMGRAHAQLGRTNDARRCYAHAIEHYTAAGPGTAKDVKATQRLLEQLDYRPGNPAR